MKRWEYGPNGAVVFYSFKKITFFNITVMQIRIIAHCCNENNDRTGLRAKW